MIGLALIVAFATKLPAEPPEPLQSPQQDGRGVRVAVEWTGVRATPGCFFFSGPGRLGRDDQLGTSACVEATGPVRVDFGSAVFTGSTGRATRRSPHTFHGNWLALESLDGTFVADGSFSGTYRYEECERGKACPGRCRIDASVRFTPVGRCEGGPPQS